MKNILGSEVITKQIIVDLIYISRRQHLTLKQWSVKLFVAILRLAAGRNTTHVRPVPISENKLLIPTTYIVLFIAKLE